MQKLCKKSLSAHHCTTLSGYIFPTNWHVSTIGKKLLNSNNISSTCPHNMVNFGPLTAEIGSAVWGAPANFNGFHFLASSLLGFVTALMLLSGGQPNFAQCLAVSCACFVFGMSKSLNVASPAHCSMSTSTCAYRSCSILSDFSCSVELFLLVFSTRK